MCVFPPPPLPRLVPPTERPIGWIAAMAPLLGYGIGCARGLAHMPGSRITRRDLVLGAVSTGLMAGGIALAFLIAWPWATALHQWDQWIAHSLAGQCYDTSAYSTYQQVYTISQALAWLGLLCEFAGSIGLLAMIALRARDLARAGAS